MQLGTRKESDHCVRSPPEWRIQMLHLDFETGWLRLWIDACFRGEGEFVARKLLDEVAQFAAVFDRCIKPAISRKLDMPTLIGSWSELPINRLMAILLSKRLARLRTENCLTLPDSVFLLNAVQNGVPNSIWSPSLVSIANNAPGGYVIWSGRARCRVG